MVAIRIPPSMARHPLRRLAEPDERDLRRIDHAEHGVDALVAQVGHGDRRDPTSPNCAARPARARATRSVRSPINSSSFLLGDVVDRRCHQTAAAQRDRHADMRPARPARIRRLARSR